MNALGRFIPPLDDGIAWAVAAVVLLAAVFLAQVPVPVAILVSLIAYVGLALARADRTPRPEEATQYLGRSDEESLQIARRKVAELRQLRRDIRDPEVAKWLDDFANQAYAITGVIAEDRKLRAAPLFLQGIIIPSEDLLREYARLERRGVQAAEPVLGRIECENLPLISRATEEFYQQLHQSDIAEIDTLSERLEYNLTDRLPAIGRGDR